MRSILVPVTCSLLVLAACGGSDAAESDTGAAPAAEPSSIDGISIVSPQEAASVIADPPADLVILDVRTEQEFAEARIEGAVMLDFYRDDFAEALAAEFDTDVPYVLYCRSDNRSGQAREIMRELGFTDVLDVDGGIVGWVEAGLPVVSG